MIAFHRPRTILITLMAVLFSGHPAGAFDFGNDHLSFSFDEDRGFALSGMRDVEEGVDLIRANGARLWRIIWTDSMNNRYVSDSAGRGGRSSRIERYAGGIRLHLRWEGQIIAGEAVGVRVEVDLPTAGVLSTWSLWIDDAGTGLRPVRVDFPLIGGLSFGEERAELALPIYWGRRVEDPVHRLPVHRMMYPSPASMQFVGFCGERSGLYLAAYDPDIWMKSWLWKAEGDRSTGMLTIEHYFPLDSPDASEIPYPVVVGLVRGGWAAAAAEYRGWAVNQKWCRSGTIAERKDIPAWFKDVALWLKYYNEPGKVLSELVDHASFVGVPSALLYYRYPESDFDDNYPEYLPARDGFAEAIESIHRFGARVIPYTSGAVWDTDTDSWYARNGREGAVVRDSGEIYRSRLHGTSFAHMCPRSPRWRDEVLRFTSALVGDYSVDGVYLDVMAAGAAMACSSPGHGHTVNGGTYWGEGTRGLMSGLRDRIREINPDAVFTTEEINEAYLDRYDGFLTLDITRGANEPPYAFIPMFSAVYHDYAIQFGSDAKLSAPADRFCGLLAANFILGSKPTLSEYSPPPIASTGEKGEYLRNVTRCYDAVARDFLLEGRWMRPPAIPGDSLRIPVRWTREIEITLPAILRSLWETADGRVGLVLTNWTGEPRRARFTLRLDEARPASGVLYVRALWPLPADAPTHRLRGPWAFDQVLPPRSLAVYEFRPDSLPPPVSAVYGTDRAFRVARRDEEGRYPIPDAGPDSVWATGRGVLETAAGKAPMIDGIAVRDDFLLLERIPRGSGTPAGFERPVPPLTTRPDRELDQISSASASIIRACRELNARDRPLPRLHASESIRDSLMNQIDRRTGVALTLPPPPHRRLIPGTPLTIAARIRNRSDTDFLLEDYSTLVARPTRLRESVEIDVPRSSFTGARARIGAEGRVIPTRLFLNDPDATGHALTVYAIAKGKWNGIPLTLSDQITIPCDVPILTNLEAPGFHGWLAGSSQPLTLTVRNVSDDQLELEVNSALPAGWDSSPDVPFPLVLAPEGRPGSRKTRHVSITPPAGLRYGRQAIELETRYRGSSEGAEMVRGPRAVLEGETLPAFHPRIARATPSTPGVRPDVTRIRGNGRLFTWLKSGEPFEMEIENTRVASITTPMEYAIRDPAGRGMDAGVLQVGEKVIASFRAPVSGAYTLTFDARQSSASLAGVRPLAAFEASRSQPFHLFKAEAHLYFFVPARSRKFSVRVTSGSEYEPGDLVLYDPDGNVVRRAEHRLLHYRTFEVATPPAGRGKVWSLDVRATEDLALELGGDVYPFLSRTPLSMGGDAR